MAGHSRPQSPRSFWPVAGLDSRALAWSNTGSPRFTDFPSNLIGREYETNALRKLRKSGPARALDPCHRPEGLWALGTRMMVGEEVASIAHVRGTSPRSLSSPRLKMNKWSIKTSSG